MTKKITNLALCGGGVLGYAEIGTISEMEKYKDSFDIQHISGTSVGSMVAALYAVGYDAEEMKQLILDLDMEYLIKDSWIPYYNIINKYGMYDANRLVKKLDEVFKIKTGKDKCTFADLPIKLTIVTTNLNTQKVEYINRDTNPLMPVSQGVRMSISYPGIFTPVYFNGSYYVDGGEAMSYPILLFDDQLDRTLGLTFINSYENRDSELTKPIPIGGMIDFFKANFSTITRATYVSQVKQKHLDRSIVITNEDNIPSMQLQLSKEEKMTIFEYGVKAFKEQWDKINAQTG